MSDRVSREVLDQLERLAEDAVLESITTGSWQCWLQLLGALSPLTVQALVAQCQENAEPDSGPICKEDGCSVVPVPTYKRCADHLPRAALLHIARDFTFAWQALDVWEVPTRSASLYCRVAELAQDHSCLKKKSGEAGR